MATEIYFRGGQQLTVRESIDQLTNAIENLGSKPIPVTSYHGARSFLNWSNVLHIEDRPEMPDPSTVPGLV
jgi:hypothetical protein